jgi:hypothetical protein
MPCASSAASEHFETDVALDGWFLHASPRPGLARDRLSLDVTAVISRHLKGTTTEQRIRTGLDLPMGGGAILGGGETKDNRR